MAFTKALFYPWIDIKDECWLKNAMLYWEKIQTIVPASIEQPYSTRTAQELYEEGLLVPFHVKPSMTEVKELTTDVINWLGSPEGTEVLTATESSKYHYIHPEKLPEEVREIVRIHPEKLPYEIQNRIRKDLSSRKGDWISVDARFANFYMTLLVTHLSERIGAGLLTDTAASNRLSTTVKLDAQPPRLRYDDYEMGCRRSYTPHPLAQGLLADLILERIQIDPDTSVKKILEFRRDYADELGRFRTKIDELTSAISGDQPLEALRQRVYDIYVNEVMPATNSLKKGLASSNITWGAENFLKVTFFSTTSTSVPLAVLGLSVPMALLVGAGISVVASVILYNKTKAQILRENPFSYLLAIEDHLVKSEFSGMS